MALNYKNLDALSRPHMVAELKIDIANGRLYRSPRLTAEGINSWPALLEEALSEHDDAWLAAEIQRRGLLRSQEERQKPTGGVTLVKVSAIAHETLAEGEFNRFYVRGLCLRATQEGIANVVAYRARASSNPRPGSEAIIGKSFDPKALLADLRVSQGVEPALGVPPGPNSGLSVRLP